MDKKTFISQLRQALSVLQKDELEDIVTEYEQHIDMKRKNGLSEEEAIADFGSFEELTAEILSAYHVRADYAQGQKKERKRLFPEDGAAGKELLLQTGQTCRNVGEKAAGGIRGLGAWIFGILRFWKQKIGGGFSRVAAWWRNRRHLEVCEDGGNANSRISRSRRREKEGWENPFPGGIRGCFQRIMALAAACVHLGLAMAAWGIRMIWNICWIGFACFCAAFGLFSLFTLGMLAVLWMQHYPLAGVTVGCLGLVLCSFSAAWFSMTLLWRKRIKGANEEMEGEQHA